LTPLAGANVFTTVLNNGTVTATVTWVTGQDGSYSLFNLPPNNYAVTASQPLYQSNTANLTVNNSSIQHDFHLLLLTPTFTNTPTATATLTASATPTNTATATPIPLPIFLPVVFIPPVVVNGGFEDGLSGWQTGGVLPVGPNSDPLGVHSGSGSALLGDPSFGGSAFCAGGVPVGNAYISQTIAVPSVSNPTLTFWYRIFTQDWMGPDPNHPKYDWFGVYVGAMDDSHPHFYDGNPNVTIPACNTPLDLGFRQGSIDLTAYRGQQITIYFANWNEGSGYFNTYTYVDDVAVATPTPLSASAR
jgi:hypothetical protein